MITSLANITQIQGDIKNSEAEIYTDLLGGQLEDMKHPSQIIMELLICKRTLTMEKS